MKKIVTMFVSELIVIILFLFCINNYVGYTPKVINADGIGYYEYLPSTFIHKDIKRLNRPIKNDSLLYNNLNKRSNYTVYGNYMVNKYPVGTSILQAPFFAIAYFNTERNNTVHDGYQPPFQNAILISSIFYLFLSLFLMKRILYLYEIEWPIILLCQVVMAIGTGLVFYTTQEPAYSHVYSLFAISAFTYFTILFFKNPNHSDFFKACILLGLIVLIRQPNLLVLLFIPFLSSSITQFKGGLIWLFRKKPTLIIGIAIFLSISLIQCFFWYLQTGEFIIYSYQNESFNFSSPEIYNILFSYKKGLFVYTPVLLIATLSVIYLFYKKKYFQFFSWFVSFTIITYVFSSWWSWFYGCSYGQRVYIDYYIFFIIPLAILLQRTNLYLKSLIVILVVIAIPVNLIQTYQYKNFILHWMNMDKEKYWKVFLHTESQYRGLNWKKTYNSENYTTKHEIFLDQIVVQPNQKIDLLFGSMKYYINPEKISMVNIKFDNTFDKFQKAKFALFFIDTISNEHIFMEKSILEFHEKELNSSHRGEFYFELPPISNSYKYNCQITSLDHEVKLKNINIQFLERKENL